MSSGHDDRQLLTSPTPREDRARRVPLPGLRSRGFGESCSGPRCAPRLSHRRTRQSAAKAGRHQSGRGPHDRPDTGGSEKAAPLRRLAAPAPVDGPRGSASAVLVAKRQTATGWCAPPGDWRAGTPDSASRQGSTRYIALAPYPFDHRIRKDTPRSDDQKAPSHSTSRWHAVVAQAIYPGMGADSHIRPGFAVPRRKSPLAAGSPGEGDDEKGDATRRETQQLLAAYVVGESPGYAWPLFTPGLQPEHSNQ